jgi:SHS2 domain-containing protein
MFEILQHTADVRLLVRASSTEDLFRDALHGMFAIMNTVRDGAPVRATISVDSVDRTALLVDFLGAALSRAQIDRVAFDEIRFTRLTETEVEAELGGHQAWFEQDVKAVTYHEADVRFVDGEWMTMLVFDI